MKKWVNPTRNSTPSTSWRAPALRDPRSSPSVSSDAISAAARAGWVTHESRSSRASRNTSPTARLRSINSPFNWASFSLRSCAFSTSLAVLACRKVAPPPLTGAGNPSLRSVSPTADSAVFGTGFSFGVAGTAAAFDPRCFAGSVIAARPSSRKRSMDEDVATVLKPELYRFFALRLA